MHIHTEIINQCCKAVNAQSYLEIGINDRTKNFDLINCRFKIGVDPNPAAVANFTGTSDEFFEKWLMVTDYDSDSTQKENWGFDVIFLDGLHHHDQLKKDFENALACLKPGGLIIMHDTNPAEERFTHVPRDVRGRWNGSCYKFVPELVNYKVDWTTCEWEPNGVTVAKMIEQDYEFNSGRPFRDFDEFVSQKQILHFVNRQKFEQWLTS